MQEEVGKLYVGNEVVIERKEIQDNLGQKEYRKLENKYSDDIWKLRKALSFCEDYRLQRFQEYKTADRAVLSLSRKLNDAVKRFTEVKDKLEKNIK